MRSLRLQLAVSDLSEAEAENDYPVALSDVELPLPSYLRRNRGIWYSDHSQFPVMDHSRFDAYVVHLVPG